MLYLRKPAMSAFTLVELLVVVAIIALLIAILLPSLQKARYQAKIVVCKTTLRGLGVAMITYASDGAGRYPTAAPPNLTTSSWFGSEWMRSWEWKRRTSYKDPLTGETRTYDLRPVYRDYLGGSLNRFAKCPLAAPYFADNNLDNLYLSNYMLYVTNNAYTKHFYFDPQDKEIVSSKRGRAWSTTWYPAFKFSLLASDAAFGKGIFGYNGAVSGHPAPQGYYQDAGGPINDFPGYGIGKPGEPPLDVPVNYLNDDGSVHGYNMNNSSWLDTGNWLTAHNYYCNRSPVCGGWEEDWPIKEVWTSRAVQVVGRGMRSSQRCSGGWRNRNNIWGCCSGVSKNWKRG